MSGQGDISAVLRQIMILPHDRGNCWRDRLTIRPGMAVLVYFFVDLFIVYGCQFIWLLLSFESCISVSILPLFMVVPFLCFPPQLHYTLVSTASGLPRNFFRGGVQKIQLRTEDREDGDLGAVTPLVRGSGGSCSLVQEISFHIVKFSQFLVLQTIYDDNQFICHC